MLLVTVSDLFSNLCNTTRMHSSRMRTVRCSGRLSCHTRMPPCCTYPPAMHAPTTHVPPAIHAPTTYAPLWTDRHL